MQADYLAQARLARGNMNSLSPLPPATYFRPPQRVNPEYNKNQCAHLINADLWEAVSGERLSTTRLFELQEMYLPPINQAVKGQPVPTPQSLHYVMMAKDRQECHILQEQISKASPKEIETIFNALYPNMNELVTDGAANFVIQRLCEFINSEQQTLLLKFFLQDIQRIVDHPNGCRVLQKFIEKTSVPNIDKIFIALLPNFIQLCSSQNGNHIAQRFILYLPDRIPIIIDTIKGHVVNLVIDNWGCRVIQQLFDSKIDIEKLLPLVDEVSGYAATLAVNQYGNYVVQNILSAGKPEHITTLIEQFTGHFYEFSIHKFASNVIEKCIRQANKQQKMAIFTEIIGTEGNYDETRIYKMIMDQFGNYVIQRIIEFGSESQQNAIYTVVYKNYDTFMRCSYSKHVISCLQKLDFDFN